MNTPPDRAVHDDPAARPKAAQPARLGTGGLSRRRMLGGAMAAGAFALTSAAFNRASSSAAWAGGGAPGSGQAGDPALTLWFNTVGVDWQNDAFPVGNGWGGAMIFGGVQTEQIQFNNETLWTGGARLGRGRPRLHLRQLGPAPAGRGGLGARHHHLGVPVRRAPLTNLSSASDRAGSRSLGCRPRASIRRAVRFVGPFGLSVRSVCRSVRSVGS